jgi:hypothetical protein
MELKRSTQHGLDFLPWETTQRCPSAARSSRRRTSGSAMAPPANTPAASSPRTRATLTTLCPAHAAAKPHRTTACSRTGRSTLAKPTSCRRMRDCVYCESRPRHANCQPQFSSAMRTACAIGSISSKRNPNNQALRTLRSPPFCPSKYLSHGHPRTVFSLMFLPTCR